MQRIPAARVANIIAAALARPDPAGPAYARLAEALRHAILDGASAAGVKAALGARSDRPGRAEPNDGDAVPTCHSVVS